MVRDLAKAKEEARKAIERVKRNADPEWMDGALAAVVIVARENDELTTDDIWELVASTHENRAMGVVMLRAAALGIIESTDRTVKSERPDCHARPVRVWRSMLR